jgi:hypothetical protein
VSAVIAATIAAVAAFGHEFVNYVFFREPRGDRSARRQRGKYLTVGTTAAATYQAARAGMPAGGAGTEDDAFDQAVAMAPRAGATADSAGIGPAISWGGSQAVVKIDDLAKWTGVLRNITLVGIIAMAALAITEERQIAHIVPALLLAVGPATILAAEGRTDAAPAITWAAWRRRS